MRNFVFYIPLPLLILQVLSSSSGKLRITNYGLLLYAAITSVPKLLDKLTQTEFVLLWLTSLTVMITGWVLVWMFHASLKARWKRLTEIRKKYFTEEFRNAWRGGESEEATPDDPTNRNSLLWFFQAVFLVGFIFDTWILYRMHCAT
jgi:hypothetical protein